MVRFFVAWFSGTRPPGWPASSWSLSLFVFVLRLFLSKWISKKSFSLRRMFKDKRKRIVAQQQKKTLTCPSFLWAEPGPKIHCLDVSLWSPTSSLSCICAWIVVSRWSPHCDVSDRILIFFFQFTTITTTTKELLYILNS